MPVKVLFTPAVVRDLEDIYDHVASLEAPDRAACVLTGIQEIIDSLLKEPTQGTTSLERSDVPNRGHREIHFKPYRIMYRVVGDAARVYLVLDGRRDFSDTLRRRLLAE